jgi:dTDP-4-dehydrorhamnose reductase
MKTLITGAGGMLAAEVARILEGAVALSKKELDITDEASVKEALKEFSPEIVINCAGYTAVDAAERDTQRAHLANAFGPRNIAKWSNAVKARLIHISTDFVFDGNSAVPYKEDDAANPLSVYGKTKLEGEANIMRSTEDFVIIRTSWLYGRGDCFPKKILALAMEKEELAVVYDQIGSPTYAVDLAQAIRALLGAPAGVYHFSNEGVASRYDFAYATLEEFKKRGREFKLKTLRPVRTVEAAATARRPACSVLDKGKYKQTTGKTIPHWMDALRRYAAGAS